MLTTAVKPQQYVASVHKFGGSSLASAERFAAVADIVRQQQSCPLWVVVSAPGDTTDALLHIIACKDDYPARDRLLSQLQQQLFMLVQQTLPAVAAASVNASLLLWLAQVPDALAQQQFNDVLAIGERLSAALLCEVLKQYQLHAVALDARDFLRLRHHQPDFSQSKALLAALTVAGAVHVVTGYIARDENGHSITLGRNGSDYSATLLAALVQADEVSIWTDVKAIYSADPRRVSSALPYQQVSWQQACTLAQLGNPVLHARTLSPLSGTPTVLRVRSSFHPQHSGCQIVQQSAIQQGFITELNDVSVLTLAHNAAISAECLALALQQPVVTLTQQGGHQRWLLPSVCAEQAVSWLAARDVHAVWDTQRCHALAWLKAQADSSTLAVEHLLPPQQLLQRYETAQQLIWLLTSPLDTDQLQQLHQQLIRPQPVLQLIVAGAGNVGAEFLSMLAMQQQRLSPLIKLELAALLTSRQAVLAPLSARHWQQALAEAGDWQAQQLHDYVATLTAAKVVIDITPSRDFALLYPDLIAAGCHIISANKQGVTLPGIAYQQITQALALHNKRWLSNTTCGAGIPVQRTLQELRDAGDQILDVSGIFSGTLSWLLCHYDGSKAFSDFVLDARQAGLTEPDPRDDLSGKDVQRKLLVLARELGLTLELDDITLAPLLPKGLEQGSWQQFWAQRDILDTELARVFASAQAQGKVLRYVARLSLQQDKVTATVALQQVTPAHALAAIAPCDNVFVIRSNWYNDNPLVLKGPGAGRVVTAGGLHADLAQLIQQLFGSAILAA